MPPKIAKVDVDEAQRALKEALRNPIQTPASAGQIVAWIVSVFYLLISLMEGLLREVSARITDVESDFNSRIPTPVVAPTPAATVAPRDRKTRCTKCHASNHIAEYCRTTNPATMRKRIATNQKKKKSARATAATAIPTFPSMPSPFPYYGNPLAPSDSQAIHAFVADANELRRRHQQSTRDKRRVRRSATSATS